MTSKNLTCSKCGDLAPSNVSLLPGKILTCDPCSRKLTLFEELRCAYVSGMPGRYLYISELSNNLDKLSAFFQTDINMSNPFCKIILTMPMGIAHLHTKFDTIYIDTGCISSGDASLLPLEEFGLIKWVNATTMELE